MTEENPGGAPLPGEIAVIDLMLGIPSEDAKRTYDFMRPLFRDKQSLESFDFPVDSGPVIAIFLVIRPFFTPKSPEGDLLPL